MRILPTLGCITLILFSGPTLAQSTPNTTITVPVPATSAGGNNSGTITATGTFQKIFGAAPTSTPRHGCLVQNNGAASMDVSEGKTAGTATAATSYVIAAGASWSCGQGGAVLQGEIDITGTATQVFYAVQF